MRKTTGRRDRRDPADSACSAKRTASGPLRRAGSAAVARSQAKLLCAAKLSGAISNAFRYSPIASLIRPFARKALPRFAWASALSVVKASTVENEELLRRSDL